MKQSIHAISLAPAVHGWLANSHHPCILHVFDHACNLINERREVLSVVTTQIGNGPFNLVVDDEVLFSEHLDAHSSISINEQQLHLGDLTIPTVDAELWNPRPLWANLHAKRREILNQISSLSTTVPQPSLPTFLLSSLSTSIAAADLASSLSAAKKLAGLGIGLTPAGDDFILGALYAAWIIHPPQVTKALAEEIVNIAAPLTTSLSAAWLISAGRGEAGNVWHNFFDALISDDPLQIHEAADEILAVGETSGADALSGFIGVFVGWKDHCSKSVQGNGAILF